MWDAFATCYVDRVLSHTQAICKGEPNKEIAREKMVKYLTEQYNTVISVSDAEAIGFNSMGTFGHGQLKEKQDA